MAVANNHPEPKLELQSTEYKHLARISSVIASQLNVETFSLADGQYLLKR